MGQRCLVSNSHYFAAVCFPSNLDEPIHARSAAKCECSLSSVAPGNVFPGAWGPATRPVVLRKWADAVYSVAVPSSVSRTGELLHASRRSWFSEHRQHTLNAIRSVFSKPIIVAIGGGIGQDGRRCNLLFYRFANLLECDRRLGGNLRNGWEKCNLLKRRTADDIAWGSSGKDARLLAKFCRLFGRMQEGDLKLLMFMAQKMVRGKNG